ncbi:MAG: heat-shock protein HtpX [Anaerolineae bacterium]|nr:heat-shock protein HtpX [Anaerolineae bacterium]
MSQTILFLCPHGAAKSVLAAAYCQQLADQHHLDVQATSAGTEPDAVVSPAVVELLRAEGIDVADHIPRRVTPQELATAFRVISLGCDLGDLLPPGTSVEQWDDVPLLSEDLTGARDNIRAHTKQLIDEFKQN